MTQQIDKDHPPEGTYIFDLASSRCGYAINKMCMSLNKVENRENAREDLDAYMRCYGIAPEDQARIRAHDWLGLIKHSGALIYHLVKLSALLGEGLYHAGAQQRGETHAEFLATRNAPGAV